MSDADERIESMVNEVIGKTADGQSISREVNNDSDQESALGNLITDAQLYMARKTMKDNEGKALPIDFAMTNNGGIRADLAVNDQGEITWGAAQAVQPFGNVMQVVAIKGSDLIDALNQQFNEYYFLQIAGLKYTYTGEKTADGDSRQVKEITIIDEDGKEKAFDETATYHVVINDFLLGGGDGFEAFTRAKLIGALDPDTDIFVNYIKEKQEVSAKVEGRKTAAEAAGEKSLTILGSTDVHGNIWDFSYEDNAQANVGIAKIAGYAEQVRTEVGAENVVLIDNGDIVQGTILTDDLYNTDKELKKEPNPVIAAMNVAGYDSMTLGNHEFNFGQDLIKKIVKEADFPILSANTYVTETEENLVGSYTIVEKDGIKVAILGLTIPDIPLWDGPRVENLTFNGLQAEAEKQVEKIEIEEQPDVIIASIHAGLDNSNTASAARNVIENVTGIDAFIIGHDHKTIANKMPDVEGNEKPVGASKDTGSEISRIDLDLVYDEATGEWVVNDSDVQSVSMADVTASQAVKDATQAAHDETLKFISEPIGQASANFLPKEEIKGIPEAQMQPTALISLINNVQLEATGADVSAAALFKADSRLDKGDITYANIFDIYKYANTLVGVEITGKNLKAFMEDNARYYNQYQDGDLTVSFGGPGEIDSKIRVYNYDMFAGIDYQIDVSKPVGERIINPTIKGQAIKDDQVYKLAVNNYRLGGLQEKGYVTATPYFDTDPKTLRGMIAEYIKAREVIDPAEELSDNWEIIGAPGLTHFLRPVLAEGVNTGVLTVEATPNNRTPNITTLTIQDLIEADLVGKLDLASLEKVIETAYKLKEKDFTAESWSEFQTVLTEIERVLADAVKVNEQLGDDARADEGQAQAIINEKAQQLDEAIKALITTGGEGQTGDILVLTDLEQAVKEAKQLEEANYTAKTWANFVPVRDEASKVLEAAQKQNDAQQVKVSSIFSFVLKEDQVLTQAQIDEVTQTLTAAMKQLVAVNKKPHGNNQNNGGTTKPNSKPQSKFPSTGEKVADYAIIGLIVVAGTGGAYYVVNRKKAA
ncbi:5'-nucleotidase C-terminal domain-containing protein [Vagococcus zengguangii]|uniref:5'-nucleotidase C-terminal domain-containing protein n=1 Tax=Vagococcus zengguangii TaxID=2571750 RepID=UPI001108323F|nr:5'-nucleotidase C-terminal domain-containing protein [Vagococcus zengguangii]TLG80653.1 hypothetical protein FE258_04110 [Vagococcus zengguangii]